MKDDKFSGYYTSISCVVLAHVLSFDYAKIFVWSGELEEFVEGVDFECGAPAA